MAVDKAALLAYLRNRGFHEASDSMDKHIALWQSWYKGYVEEFHNFRVWNGQKHVERRRASLQLGKSVSEQWAGLLFNERCAIAIDDGTASDAEGGGVEGTNPTDQFVKLVFDRNDLYVRINEAQERKAACGTVAYIPYYANDSVRVSYVAADRIIPLSWECGVINELCVFSQFIVNGKEYVFVQLFTYDKNASNEMDAEKPTYVIENLLLEDQKAGGAGGYKEVGDISGVPGYENIKARVETKSPTRPFVVDRLNIANNIDPDSPLGLAAFANAIDTLRACDTIFDSYQNEFVLGKKRLMVATEAMNMQNGHPTFDPNELVFYTLPEGVIKGDKPFIHELNMSIRADEHRQSLQDALNTLSYQCGFGNNFFRYTDGAIETATQVISENQGMFRTLKKHEIILEAVLVDMIRLIIEIGIRHELAPGANRDAKITVSFDDSIIEDKDKEIQRRMAEVAAGLLRPEVYLAWRYGGTTDEAMAMMPGMTTGNNEEGMQ